MALPITWSLSEFFTPETIIKELASLREELTHLENKNDLQEFQKRITQVASFVKCLVVQDVTDTKARGFQAEATALQAAFENAVADLIQRLSKLSEKEFEKHLTDDTAFWFRKNRALLKEKLSIDKECLATDLAIDGYHAWHELYSLLIGKLKVPYGEQKLSFAEIDNLLSHPERKTREAAFHSWTTVCKEQADIFIQTLNHLVGFRLELQRHRKWESPLKEPLFFNNMEEKSLRTMWIVVEENKAPFALFLKEKARALNLSKISWYDLDAPFGSFKREIPYQEAAQIIIESFAAYSSEMASFAEHALTHGWVDAEARNTKAPGGFCTPFPQSKESRIFMNYSNSFDNLLTLAHELGHAYHSHQIFHLESVAQEYPMTLAETASTLAEHLVLEHLLITASKEEKQAILQSKAQRSTTFFMNIHARFLFEEAFFEERREKVVSEERICKLMEEAEKKGYSNSLQEYHPYFWLTKQHFHLSDLPFYNFPYTVGYLMSLAIVKKAREKKAAFSDWYTSFLQDTGKMSAEDIVKKHFGYSLSQKQFWQEAMDVAISDLKQLQS
ncbi:MAG: family oligoendopeptidase [Chlamydiia bacterium]|nr:family oligoendopeptidase [Chlamydiia bacterium]